MSTLYALKAKIREGKLAYPYQPLCVGIKLCISILLLFIHFSLQAQQVEIIVKDSVSGNFIANASITIEQTELKSSITGVTDQLGKAILHNQSFPMNVLIRISATDYLPFISNTLLINADTTLYYNLTKPSTVLEEILIVDPRSLIYSQGKITYIPRKTAFDQTQSITELFPSIPGIAKRNGKFFFRNESNFIILIDGNGENKSKEEQLLALENMPVNSILKIEFIDQPGIRYGGNITGIINVITKKNIAYSVAKLATAMQDFSSEGTTSYPLSLHGNIDSRFRIKNSNIQLAIRSNHNKQIEAKYNNIAFQPFQDIKQNSLLERKAATFYSYLSIDHSFNERLSAQLSTYFTNNTIKEEGTSRYTYASSNLVDSSFQTKDIGSNTNFRYVLTPQLKFLVDTAKNMTIYFNSTMAQLGDDYADTYKHMSANEELSSRLSSTTQLIYLDLIGDNLLNGKTVNLSAGAKFQYLSNKAGHGQSFKYQEYVHNLFVSSHIQLTKTSIRSGLRAEILDFRNQQEGLSSQSQMINLFPTLTIQRQLGAQKNVSLGYTRNTLRMSSIAYNNQVRYKGYLNGTAGNKDLKPRITDHIYLQFYLKTHVISANYKLHTNHRIFLPIDSVKPYIMQATTYNQLKQFYLNYSKDFEISKIWSSNLGMYGYYNHMDNSQLAFTYKRAINYQFDWYNTLTLGTYSAELGLNYNSPYKTEWGKLKPVLYNNLTFSKVLRDNAWNIRMTINDFLGLSKEESTLNYPLLTRHDEQLNHQRNINIQLSYRFPFGKKTRLNQYQTDLKDEIRN